nr:heparinase II/III family protein [Clostridia bacterium]
AVSKDYGSVHLASNCIGVLRSPDTEVFFKYGNLCRSHAHPDALSICIPPFAYDLGTSGYGSPYYRGWYATTLSHSSFTVDGLSQNPQAKGIGTLSEDGTTLDMSVEDAYEGVSAKRSLRLSGNRLEDRLTVSCAVSRQVDWFFHGAGDFACEGELIPDKLPEAMNGYGHLKNVKKARGPFRARYVKEGRSLTLAFDQLPAGAAVYVAESPDNPADQIRHTVLVRMQGTAVELSAVFEMGSEA